MDVLPPPKVPFPTWMKVAESCSEWEKKMPRTVTLDCKSTITVRQLE